MQSLSGPPARLRFGVFEADLRLGELTKAGKRVRLQEQPFRVLAMLLERPGELVTRAELHNKLWPQTIVDFDHGLNKAVSKIRDALGDSAENPRFVETIWGGGYRFVADVTAVEEPTPADTAVTIPSTPVPVAVAPVDEGPGEARPRRLWWASSAAALILIA